MLNMLMREGVPPFMKFSIRQSSLLQTIQTVSKAVAVRTTKQVLTGILLQARDDTLTATAYDLELGIQDKVIASEDNGLNIVDEGSIVLPARYFADVIRKLPGQEVWIRVNNNYMTEIRSGQAEFHLHGIDAAEFPKLPVFNGAQSIQVASDLLKELIRTTTFAAANSEVRPILTGIHVVCKQNQMTFTATDGLRLATRTVSINTPAGQEWNAILPAKSLAELAKLLPDDERPITVQLTNSHSLFIIDDTYFYTRLIEGTYPDTSRIIPTSAKTEVTVKATELTDAIDRAALIARDRDNHMVRLELTDNTLILSSSSPEIGNVSESVQATSKAGEDMSIAFNAKYVLDALKAMSADEINVRFNGWNQPFTFREVGNENGLQLISPVLMR
jgi:DNA polymerase III subunit beta